jgi:hypothetical protein
MWPQGPGLRLLRQVEAGEAARAEREAIAEGLRLGWSLLNEYGRGDVQEVS